MSRILEAEAIVKAKDATGGVFEGIARKIAQIDRASRAVTRDIEKQMTVANRIEQKLSRTDRYIRSIERGTHAAGAAAAGAAATYTGAKAIEGARRIVTRSGKEAADRQHEIVRERVAGMPEDQIKDNERLSNDMSAKYPALSATSLMHMTRNIRAVVGSYEEAKEILEPLAQLRTIALATHPERAGELNEQFDSLIKGEEIRGTTQDMPRFTKNMNLMAKAINAFGDTLNVTDFYEMAKYSRLSGQYLSDDFFLQAGAAIGQELRGKSAGDAFESFSSAIVGGKMTNLAAKEFVRLGLVNDDMVERTTTGNVKGIRPGGMKGVELAQSNPFDWVHNLLLPAFKKAGIDGKEAIGRELAVLFGNRVARQYVNILAAQAPRLNKDQLIQSHAYGLNAADAYMRDDLKMRWAAVDAQFGNSLATGTKALVDPAKTGLGWLSDAITTYNQWGQNHPAPAAAATVGATGAGLAAGSGLLWYGLKEAGNAWSGRPSMTVRTLGTLGRFFGPMLPMIMAQFQSDILNDKNDPIRRRILAATRLEPELFGRLSDLDSQEDAFNRTGFGGRLGKAVRGHIDRERTDIESRLAELGYGPAGVPGRGRMDTVARPDLLDSLRPGGAPIEAQLKGEAEVKVTVNVTAGDGLKADIQHQVSSAVGNLRVSGSPASGTAGSLGRSSPDATPPQ